MDILDVGINRGLELGREQGLEKGIQAVIETCRELAISKTNTKAKIIEKFNLPEEKAKEYIEKYWK